MAGARSSSPRSATCSARARSSRSTSSRCGTTTRSTRGSRTSAGAPRPTPTSSPTSRARADGKRVLVILDSDHSQAHVEAELAEYASLVPVGCYLIVEDSNIGQIRKDLLPGPARGDRDVPRRERRVRDRSRAREVPHHLQPERLPPARSLVRRRRSGAAPRSTTRRRRARNLRPARARAPRLFPPRPGGRRARCLAA